MSLSEIQKERNEQCRERHELAVNRIRSMVTEETVEKAYVGYFHYFYWSWRIQDGK